MQRRLASLIVLLVALLAPRAVLAHAAPRSVVLLDLRESDVAAELRLPVPELEAALGHSLAANGVLSEAEKATLQSLISGQFQAFSPDHGVWRTELRALTYAVEEPAPVIVARVRLVPPAGHSARIFTLENEVIARAVRNHASWILLRSDSASGSALAQPSLLGTTHYLHHTVEVNREQASRASVFRALFRAGTRHIATGTDHLLFLLALLLPLPLASRRESLARVLGIVTAFTIGHCLTLLVGALGWLHLPSARVEVLIAVSILISAVHAVRPIFPGREAWVAAGFGLVHGLAFASALNELALAQASLVAALLGFNLGIEAMQLAIVAVSLPWLLLLAAAPVYGRFRALVAGAIALAALAWIGQRAFGLPNPLDGAITALAGRPLLLLGALALFTQFARRAPRAGRNLGAAPQPLSAAR